MAALAFQEPMRLLPMDVAMIRAHIRFAFTTTQPEIGIMILTHIYNSELNVPANHPYFHIQNQIPYLIYSIRQTQSTNSLFPWI